MKILILNDNFFDYPQNCPKRDSVCSNCHGQVNGWCLPRSGRRDILSVAITAFIFIGVILRIIIIIFGQVIL